MRVVTEPTPGYFSSVGVYIDAGSRFESPRLSGASHIMDRMAFKVCTEDLSFHSNFWGLGTRSRLDATAGVRRAPGRRLGYCSTKAPLQLASRDAADELYRTL